MSDKTFFPTSHIAEVNNYPYGRLQCTAFFGTEFQPKKGFRSTFQTINPKTGRLNAVKNSTYSDISLLYEDPETGHFKHAGYSPRSGRECETALAFVLEHFDLWTRAELEHIAGTMYHVAKADIQAIVTYCGADQDEAIRIGKPPVLALAAAFKDPTRENFEAVKFDCAAMDALKVPDFNPFTVRSYGAGS